MSKENLFRVEIKTLNISLIVPKEHGFYENNDKISINLNPKDRVVKQFSIDTSKSTIYGVKFKKSFLFENGAKLNYNLSTSQGGSEFSLMGVFEFEDKKYLITSLIQGGEKSVAMRSLV